MYERDLLFKAVWKGMLPIVISALRCGADANYETA
jgi:hypothetical protein